jgi:ABC-type Na+ efflux pump permease subunit
MNPEALRAIVRKDLTAVARSRAVLIPLIMVPVIMLVLIPALAAFAPRLTELPGSTLSQFQTFLERAPAGLKASLAGYTPAQQIVVLSLVYFLAPLYLIVPLMVSSVIAADSFAGEKERKTLEALLYTPTSDRELFLAKALSPWLAAVAVGLLGFLVYSGVANLVTLLTLDRLLFPNALWLALALWLGPALAGLSLGTTVLVSARVNSFQEAFQLGGVIVLPVVGLLIGQVTGLMYFSVGLVLLLGLLVWVLDAVVLHLAFRLFRRDQLAARL